MECCNNIGIENMQKLKMIIKCQENFSLIPVIWPVYACSYILTMYVLMSHMTVAYCSSEHLLSAQPSMSTSHTKANKWPEERDTNKTWNFMSCSFSYTQSKKRKETYKTLNRKTIKEERQALSVISDRRTKSEQENKCNKRGATGA